MNDFNYRFTVKIACNFCCGLKQSCNVLLLVLLFLLFFTLDILLKIWYIVALFWRGRKQSNDWCEFLMKICIFPLRLHFFFSSFHFLHTQNVKGVKISSITPFDWSIKADPIKNCLNPFLHTKLLFMIRCCSNFPMWILSADFFWRFKRLTENSLDGKNICCCCFFSLNHAGQHNEKV